MIYYPKHFSIKLGVFSYPKLHEVTDKLQFTSEHGEIYTMKKNCQMFMASLTRHFVRKFKIFFIVRTCVRAVGNPSAIEGQTANILNLRTGL